MQTISKNEATWEDIAAMHKRLEEIDALLNALKKLGFKPSEGGKT
ncbi:MAG: hypothetical protein RBG13Loki_0606 [Promethearchaeota archaeon CR_4]|nr:MAG: hypothetical protein RBG13Loki_0606 [Candidatus Lokiarchaeota archaeon CR_4]